MTGSVHITDTTLRDGSHAMAHQFTEQQVRDTVRALDATGVEVIEVAHGDGLGGSSFNYGFSAVSELTLISAAVEEAQRARIAVLLLPGVGTVDDLRAAHECGATVARIATHCTEADVSLQHFAAARELGMSTVGFLMLSHRLAPKELAAQARIMADAGCQCVYVVDSAGALVLDDVTERVTALADELGSDPRSASTATRTWASESRTPFSPGGRAPPGSTDPCADWAPERATRRRSCSPPSSTDSP
jgi:4-hydroxy 2-oxovalerate aldolase